MLFYKYNKDRLSYFFLNSRKFLANAPVFVLKDCHRCNENNIEINKYYYENADFDVFRYEENVHKRMF